MLSDSFWMQLRRWNSAIIELVHWGSGSTFRVCIFSSCSPPALTDNPPTWNLLFAQSFAMFSNSFLLKTWGRGGGGWFGRSLRHLRWVWTVVMATKKREIQNDQPMIPLVPVIKRSVLEAELINAVGKGRSSAAHVSLHVFRPVFRETKIFSLFLFFLTS